MEVVKKQSKCRQQCKFSKKQIKCYQICKLSAKNKLSVVKKAI